MDPTLLTENITAIFSTIGPRIQHSYFLMTIKAILGVYTVILFIDFVLLMMSRGLRGNIRTMVQGMDIPKINKSKLLKQWELIEKRLSSDVESQYKVAIIEADKLVEGILGNMGYAGKNMKEKLEKIQPGQIENFEELTRTHEIRNHIVYDADFRVNKEVAKEALVVYKQFLREIEFFS